MDGPIQPLPESPLPLHLLSWCQEEIDYAKSGSLGVPHTSAQEMADRPDWVMSMTGNCVRRGQMLWNPHVDSFPCAHLLASLAKYA